MATQTNTPAPSPIQVMHAQFEAAEKAYCLVSDAKEALRKPQAPQDQLFHRYDRAVDETYAEIGAVHRAICYQVPTSWIDATILQYHVIIARERVEGLKEPPRADLDALEVAADAVFDFLAGEHPVSGDSIAMAAAAVAERRAYRTGILSASSGEGRP